MHDFTTCRLPVVLAPVTLLFRALGCLLSPFSFLLVPFSCVLSPLCRCLSRLDPRGWFQPKHRLLTQQVWDITSLYRRITSCDMCRSTRNRGEWRLEKHSRICGSFAVAVTMTRYGTRSVTCTTLNGATNVLWEPL